MKQPRVLLGVLCAITGCEGAIMDPTPWASREQLTVSADGGQDSAASHESESTVTTDLETDDAGITSAQVDAAVADASTHEATDTRQHTDDAGPSQPIVATMRPTQQPALAVGSGELSKPVAGPSPIELAKLSGAPYTLVKNWDFGSDGNIRNMDELSSEFQFHDHFGTIANGTNYGSVTAAPDAASAIKATGLGLPNDMQPVVDPAHPIHEWTASTLLSHVRPLANSQTTVTAWKHDAINGNLTAKWKLPSGGKLLDHDVVWETRVRMPTPVPGYWFALWTAGELWNKGAEMDVLESFGAPHIGADAFHTDSVGGTNMIDYKNWPNALSNVGVPTADRELPEWHVWTWVYLRDDSYEAYYDGYLVQHGSLHWTKGGTTDGEPTDMHFLFDFSWGHTQVDDVNIELPASQFPLTYEIDYSRVYMR
jgi:hypothetical protein